MDKSNILRSSEFHMDMGDILHYILIVDSGVTPTISLVSTGDIANSEEAPDAVVALDASDITSSSFTANWYLIENASEYYLDVATDSAFTSMVAGYNNLSVGFVNEYSVVGLTDAYTYYYRVRGANWIGTGDSSNTITTTTAVENVVDFDGNVYTYVTIGSQQWMVENFRSEHYADGTAIPNLTLDADWIAEDGTVGHDGAMCYYDNDEATYKSDYGALYNWYAVDNAHGLAPAGWRVPSEADFIALIAAMGGQSVAGGKAKSIGLAYWDSPNTGATDEYGLNFKGAGYRDPDPLYKFTAQRKTAICWSTDMQGIDMAKGVSLVYTDELFTGYGGDLKIGNVVRMMRDV